ncbi:MULTISPECIES: hypothetical protein [unclassified Romboutsia]|uniref:hypothetical protein n=1 Tax=unclassified Romboutsia TaxID=2626894 RepID=UPI00082194B9|nr:MULTISPECIES: hypothetical protein [unclassified Romboutsia]SCH76633.1 Uncharacterised protein [uncultured Clostridium sp.]
MKAVTSIIKHNLYTQYILDKDLRIVLGNINEIFMPEDLFDQIAKEIYGENKVTLSLNQIEKHIEYKINIIRENHHYIYLKILN